jgi:hypothetical protein
VENHFSILDDHSPEMMDLVDAHNKALPASKAEFLQLFE